MSADELASCATIVPQWLEKLRMRQGTTLASTGGAGGGGLVILLAYLTDVAALQPWALGLSAAAHKAPLVLSGHGMRWGGAGVKLPGPPARFARQVVNPGSSISLAFRKALQNS